MWGAILRTITSSALYFIPVILVLSTFLSIILAAVCGKKDLL